VATGGVDKIARVWDTRTGALLLELKGHTSGVTNIEFSPEGSRLASQSIKEKIVWDLQTGKAIPDAPAPDWPKLKPARSADGRWLAVGFGDRIRLVDLKRPLDPRELETRLWATQFDEHWHAEQMDARQKDGDWFAAVYHVNQLLEQRPSDSELLARRDAILAEAMRRDGQDAEVMAAQAHVLLQAGKIKKYNGVCAQLAKLAHNVNDDDMPRRMAITCVLAPNDLNILVPVLTAFEPQMCNKYPEDLRIHGGLLLRVGKIEEAVRELERARNVRPDAPYEDLLLALAYERLKDIDRARACLKRAKAALDELGGPGAMQAAQGWQRVIELQVLLREAAAALEK
jgi:tetratricopeptide (TPR) repeat protein